MTDDQQTRRQHTDRAIADAQGRVNQYLKELTAISGDPSPERTAEITVSAATDVLFSALQHAAVTDTGHTQADTTLRQAITLAALKAREAVSPTVDCNLTSNKPARLLLESQEEWLHRMAPNLTAAGQAVRDVYRAILVASTDSLRKRSDTKRAGQQAINLATHVSTVVDATTNLDELRTKMPPIQTNKASPFRNAKDRRKDTTGRP